jgi:hypothetical protein
MAELTVWRRLAFAGEIVLKPLSLGMALVVLGGCAGMEGIRKDAGNLTRDLFGSKEDPPPPPRIDPRYCYRTLGRVDCYAEPLPGHEANRLVGYDGPPPRTTAGTGPLKP